MEGLTNDVERSNETVFTSPCFLLYASCDACSVLKRFIGFGYG